MIFRQAQGTDFSSAVFRPGEQADFSTITEQTHLSAVPFARLKAPFISTQIQDLQNISVLRETDCTRWHFTAPATLWTD